MLEEGPSTCEVCGGVLRRVLHPAGIIFRGSGFYKTDSRSSSSASVPSGTAKPQATSSDGASGSGSDSSGPAKGETKPATGGKSPEGGA